MNNSSKRRQHKILFLLVVIMVTTIILIVETYAWFVGTSTVSTDEFSVSVTSGDGLELSLDGTSWQSENISITKSSVRNAFNGNKNVWADYLSPVSTNGMLDTSVSRLKLYEKTSLSATSGGFRLISGRVDNYTGDEADGYVAFDLYIRNGNGNSYDSTYDSASEEDIYLASDSYASVPVSGSTNYGAANSLRVGFFEIGRIKSNGYGSSDVSTLRTISCSGGSGVTGLCSTTSNLNGRRGYTWNIWEPNASSHTTQLVSYFNGICKKRNSSGSYTGNSCNSLSVGASRTTYAVNDAISSSDNVDIYDGAELNTYTSAKLTAMSTYKTSDATSNGSNKASLIRLGGNSITKVRIYIWLEGQDIDNYDLITHNPTINIKFGLTKDRFGIDTTNTSG